MIRAVVRCCTSTSSDERTAVPGGALQIDKRPECPPGRSCSVAPCSRLAGFDFLDKVQLDVACRILAPVLQCLRNELRPVVDAVRHG